MYNISEMQKRKASFRESYCEYRIPSSISGLVAFGFGFLASPCLAVSETPPPHDAGKKIFYMRQEE